MTRLLARKNDLLRGSLCALFLLTANILSAQEPLHQRIDQLVNTGNRLAPTGVISDRDFIRRVSIDLIGMPPSREEADAFVAETSPEKRVKLVDRLIADPRFTLHLRTTLDVMLMERRRYVHVKQPEWQAYLLESVESNKPWNVLAREILSADGTDEKLRPAVRFYLARGSESNLLTRDVGRIFFGRDMQCNQCHDHPVIDDYKQADYHGLHAFLSGGYEFKAPDNKVYYAEKSGIEETFASVFFADDVKRMSPKLLGMPEIDEPLFAPGDEYTVKPDKTVRPVVKFSRRAKLAELATGGQNRFFNENIANRLWAMVMGRGLVQPVDLQHTANPPTHPELLKLLGEEIARMNFDMQAFLRELVLSQTYQRQFDLPANLIERSAQTEQLLPELQAELEQLKAAAAKQDAAYEQAMTDWHAAKDASVPVRKELNEALKKADAAYKNFAKVEAPFIAAQTKLQPKLDLAATYVSVITPTDAALASVGDHAGLKEAVAVYRQKLAAVQKQIAPLQADLDKKRAALEAPQKELTVTREALVAVQNKLQPLEQTIAEKQNVLIPQRLAMFDIWNRVSRGEQQLALLEEFKTFGPLEQQAIASAEFFDQAQQQVAAAQKSHTDYVATHKQQKQAYETAKAEFDKTSAQLAAIQSKTATLEPAVASLSDALKNARAALETLKTETALIETVSLLEVKTESYRNEFKAAEKTAAALDTAMQSLTPRYQQIEADFKLADTEMTKRATTLDKALAALKQAQTDAEAKRLLADAIIDKQAPKWASQFIVAPLKPLSPEQLAWSVMQVTGVGERYVTISTAELDKKEPLPEADKTDLAKIKARERKIAQLTYDKLLGSVNAFVHVYGAGEAQTQYDFFATVDQALFAANGTSFVSWIKPATGNVTERMIKEADPVKAAEDLYLTYLVRPPTAEETQAVSDYLTSRPDQKAACVEELTWAILNSAEFRFNH